MQKDQDSSLAEKVITILLIVGVVAVIALWNAWQKYQRQGHGEKDYVCFNDDCSYLSAADFKVNSEGTCLTWTSLVSPVEQCGGRIEITQVLPPISFWDWLDSTSSIGQ